jgi:hypothetical protein
MYRPESHGPKPLGSLKAWGRFKNSSSSDKLSGKPFTAGCHTDYSNQCGCYDLLTIIPANFREIRIKLKDAFEP